MNVGLEGRVAEKGGEREQVRLQKQALRQDRLRQTRQRPNMLGHRVCRDKLCVKIVFVRQRPNMLGYRACRDKHNISSA